MYRATVTKSLQDLKQLDYGLAIFLSAIVGGLAGGILGPSIDLYFILFILFFVAVWAATGKLNIKKPKKGGLALTKDTLQLEWMEQEPVEVQRNAVNPKYQVKHYRPLGILPKKSYIHLFIDGGPLGPHEFFFMHDGEYNASQWEKLSIEPLLDPNSSLQLIQ
jgi:hypothetical protein